MRRYITIKLLLIIPSLVLLSLIVFFLSKLAPGDPVANLVELRGQTRSSLIEGINSEAYSEVASELNLDLPKFYFSVYPSCFPDTLYKIIDPHQKKIIKSWLIQSTNWPLIQAFLTEEKALRKLILNHEDLSQKAISRQYIRKLDQIIHTEKIDKMEPLIIALEDSLASQNHFNKPLLIKASKGFSNTINQLSFSRRNPKDILPVLRFNGLNNQYHKWASSALGFNFGTSISDGREVTGKIFGAFRWTFLYILIAYILSLFIGISLGLYNAWHYKSLKEKVISSLSFLFYAFPLFWIATLAAVFLTNDHYASWLHIFPGIGIGDIHPDMSALRKIATALPYLILPALVLALHSAANGIRIVRNSALNELRSDYYITAKAKGLSKFQLIWRHIFPNSMLPVITLLISGFPAALAGSVVLEVIFNIPGLGRLLYDSINFMDWNVVFAILMFMGLITFIFYLLGDILYAYLNPKIKFQKR